MRHLPDTVGLILCERTITEEHTHNVTAVNQFSQLQVDSFPSPPQRFSVFALLIGAIGTVSFALRIRRLDTFGYVYQRSWRMTFQDRLRQVRLVLRIKQCIFPVPGAYEVILEAEQQYLAQYVCHIYS